MSDDDIRAALRPLRRAPVPPARALYEARPVRKRSTAAVALFAAALFVALVGFLVVTDRPPAAAATLSIRLQRVEARLPEIEHRELHALLRRELDLLRRELELIR